jgi:2-polyprenyl-3-methyl-5-hydroxy-6-metoxy-1,4-benzoquinol methylase
VLDFGTGSGILLPSLHAHAAEVSATDLDVSPAQTLVNILGLPTHIVPPEGFAAWRAENAGRIDLIMALDVFEHASADELPVVSKELHALLAPGGRLVVSGPTETPMYKLGRFIAGFRNVYHYRNIFDIDAQLQACWMAEETRFLPRLPRAFLLARYVSRRV